MFNFWFTRVVSYSSLRGFNGSDHTKNVVHSLVETSSLVQVFWSIEVKKRIHNIHIFIVWNETKDENSVVLPGPWVAGNIRLDV